MKIKTLDQYGKIHEIETSVDDTVAEFCMKVKKCYSENQDTPVVLYRDGSLLINESDSKYNSQQHRENTLGNLRFNPETTSVSVLFLKPDSTKPVLDTKKTSDIVRPQYEYVQYAPGSRETVTVSYSTGSSANKTCVDVDITKTKTTHDLIKILANNINMQEGTINMIINGKNYRIDTAAAALNDLASFTEGATRRKINCVISVRVAGGSFMAND